MVNTRIPKTTFRRDKARVRTPMRCPVCDSDLANVRVRDLGGLTADILWQLHAGECLEHGWFQAEFSADPPREIFPVTKPFGTARRIVVDEREYFEFPTMWGTQAITNRREYKVDPLDPEYWATESLRS